MCACLWFAQSVLLHAQPLATTFQTNFLKRQHSPGDRIVRVNKIDTRKLQAAGADISHLSAALRGPALQLTLSQGGTGRSIQTILRRDHSGDKTDEESNELGSGGGGGTAELASRQARRRQVMAERDNDSGRFNESRHEQDDALTGQASFRARIEAVSQDLGNVTEEGIHQGATAEQQQQRGRPESEAVADGRVPQVLSDIEGDAHVCEPVRVAVSAAALEAKVRGAASGLNERERVTQLVGLNLPRASAQAKPLFTPDPCCCPLSRCPLSLEPRMRRCARVCTCHGVCVCMNTFAFAGACIRVGANDGGTRLCCIAQPFRGPD